MAGKNWFDIGLDLSSLLIDVKNLVDIGRLASLLGIKKKGVANAATGAAEDGTQVAKDDGKGNIDEHNALIAMAEAHFGKELQNMSQEEYAISRTRFSRLMAIHKTLREQGKVGGSEKLMHIIGNESHLQGMVSAPKVARGQKPEDQPQRIDIQNVRDRTNPAGKLIIRFLTDIQPQEAVDLLVAASITDNSKDKTAAAAKAAKEKVVKAWDRLREWYGAHDTEIHVTAAKYLLKDFKIGEGSNARPAIDVLLESDEAIEWIRRIDAAEQDPDEQRELQERMQLWLQEKVTEIRKRKGPLRNQERQRNLDGRTDEKRHARNMRLIYIASSIATALVILIGMVQGALR